uniref:TSA: Wollemia nobilis Ref_Wollemi_Transcript_7968_1245 transcribed RNA sequence n=1 Tax=Wollemia nobilis TaxID=56998 RepID=A0A0C9QUU2_9CONI
MALQTTISSSQFGTIQLPRSSAFSVCIDQPVVTFVQPKKSKVWRGQSLQQQLSSLALGKLPRRQSGFLVRASLETIAPALGKVTEVDKDSFWPAVDAAGDKVVVLDMYTQWCGPCKIIAPKVEQLSGKYSDVVFLKLDCNQENKPLAKELGVRVVPTFKILKGKKIVKEVTGAKLDDLVHAIETAKASA